MIIELEDELNRGPWLWLWLSWTMFMVMVMVMRMLYLFSLFKCGFWYELIP
jgi:hypothetical protein